MSKTTAAIKIQRAWRNYQTLKMVKKYYNFYKGMVARENELKEVTNENVKFSNEYSK